MGTRRLRELSARSTALDWNGETPFRTAGKDEQASTVTRAGWWKAGRDQRSPLRRCFKPRPPLRAGCAGFASGCRSSGFGAQAIADSNLRSCSGRLSGLLSGCPPTDTRPQARANLGKSAHKSVCTFVQAFFSVRENFSCAARRSAAPGERLDLLRGANELNHHHDTEEHEHDVED